jgi:hypothetical protein
MMGALKTGWLASKISTQILVESITRSPAFSASTDDAANSDALFPRPKAPPSCSPMSRRLLWSPTKSPG